MLLPLIALLFSLLNPQPTLAIGETPTPVASCLAVCAGPEDCPNFSCGASNCCTGYETYCYGVGGGCTQNSDCCTGLVCTGTPLACDYPVGFIPTATPTPAPSSTPSPTPIPGSPTPTPTQSPAWYQAEGSDFISLGAVLNHVPSSQTLISTSSQLKAGLCLANTSSLNIGTGSYSSTNYVVSSPLDLNSGNGFASSLRTKYGYSYFADRIQKFASQSTLPSSSLDSTTLLAAVDSATSNIDGFKYLHSSSITITSDVDFGSRQVVLHSTSDITIHGNLLTTSGMLILLASGDIKINSRLGSSGSPSTTNLEGVFMANNIDTNFNVSSVDDPDPLTFLKVEGSLIGFNSINMGRTSASLVSSTYPTELVVFRPEFVTRLPKPFLRQYTSWREIP